MRAPKIEQLHSSRGSIAGAVHRTYAEYRLGDEGLLGGTGFRVGAHNLFDEEQPLFSNNFGFLGSLHNAIGRFIYFEPSKEF